MVLAATLKSVSQDRGHNGRARLVREVTKGTEKQFSVDASSDLSTAHERPGSSSRMPLKELFPSKYLSQR